MKEKSISMSLKSLMKETNQCQMLMLMLIWSSYWLVTDFEKCCTACTYHLMIIMLMFIMYT